MVVYKSDLHSLFICPRCSASFEWHKNEIVCTECGNQIKILDCIPRFVTSLTHDNFAIQWKKFSDVQLDSHNGTTCSRDRLLAQCGLQPEDFKGKKILEVGCGAGRFTEILVNFGAKIISVDYSSAVEACALNNASAFERGQLTLAQADVFSLPFKLKTFDIVMCYGVLQHTGNANLALKCLWEHVAVGGVLLVDRYQLSFRHFLPFKYLLRPLMKRMHPLKVLALAENTCKLLVPLQRKVLRSLKGDGFKRYIRHVINRSPNSVYPLNLEIEGKLTPEIAFQWSVLDTFDQWAPKYDMPQTLTAWRAFLEKLQGGEVIHCGTAGQGNIGLVKRIQD